MSIKNNYLDRRIIKSKGAMKDALITLMNVKDFKEISVSEIVQTANLNRGTFYKHYQYKEDILKEIIDEVITDLIESYRDPYKNIEVLELDKLTTSAIKIFDHVSKYKSFYSLIVQTNTLADFQHKFCAVLKELALNDLNGSHTHPNIDRELQASYQAYAILGLIIEWISGGFKYSSNYMAEQLLEIIKLRHTNSIVKIKNL